MQILVSKISGIEKAKYINVKMDKSGKKIDIGGYKYAKDGVNLKILAELSKSFADKLNQYNDDNNSSLSNRIRENIKTGY